MGFGAWGLGLRVLGFRVLAFGVPIPDSFSFHGFGLLILGFRSGLSSFRVCFLFIRVSVWEHSFLGFGPGFTPFTVGFGGPFTTWVYSCFLSLGVSVWVYSFWGFDLRVHSF